MAKSAKLAGKAPSAAEKVPELLTEVVNARKEEDEIVVQLANEETAALIAFIAPYVGVRISPIEEARASISLPDEFGIEVVMRELRARGTKRAYFLVNSPGGAMDSSYKIARAVRQTFQELVTFVPHVAASGGTMLALTGNEIVMGPMSHITPLDVQLRYKGTAISAATFMRSFARASKWFEKTSPEEAPYPRKAIADKLDPFLMEEWSGLMDTARDYVSEILTLAGYKNSQDIADKLVMEFPSHSYVITREKAVQIGLNAKDASEYPKVWDVMRYWLSKYMFEQEPTHCIRYVLPAQMKEETPAKQREADNG